MSASFIARCAGFVACALVNALPVSAQREAVPRELVDVLWLLDRNNASGAVLHIGRVPDRLRGITDAAGVRVIGAVERGSSITTAVAIRGDAPTAVAEWNRRLAQNGWTLQPPRLPQRPTGFVPSRPPGADGDFRGFCSSADKGSISVRSMGAPGGETYIVSSYAGPSQGNRCTSPALVPGPGRPRDEMLPSLSPPPGAIVINNGGGSSTGEADARATLTTDLSAAALIDHYGREMNAQGWAAVERSVGNSSALSVWRKDAAANAPALFGWLSALQLPDGSRSMQVRVMTTANPAASRPGS